MRLGARLTGATSTQPETRLARENYKKLIDKRSPERARGVVGAVGFGREAYQKERGTLDSMRLTSANANASAYV